MEDDDDNREVLAQTLTAEGASVVVASTAAEALPLMPSADIIVTDYALPCGDAVWLSNALTGTQGPRPIPVLVVSGYDERQEPRMATAPFAAKLLKPVDLDRLCGEIVAALENRA